jgi:hypothetical protein
MIGRVDIAFVGTNVFSALASMILVAPAAFEASPSEYV